MICPSTAVRGSLCDKSSWSTWLDLNPTRAPTSFRSASSSVMSSVSCVFVDGLLTTPTTTGGLDWSVGFGSGLVVIPCFPRWMGQCGMD